MKGDSAVVIIWRMGKGVGSWCLAHIIHETWEIMYYLGISLFHVVRKQNALADELANWVVGLTDMYSEVSLPEGCL